MAVAFIPGAVLGRGDLDIFLQNSAGNPANAAELWYSLHWVDPGPPEAEVLIGAAQRVPMNPAVGEYYASNMIPPGATLGTYRIRWTLRELINSPLQVVVQEFAVVGTGQVQNVSPYTDGQLQMIGKLRMLLRDQCVGGEELIDLDVGGTPMRVRLDDLWLALENCPRP